MFKYIRQHAFGHASDYIGKHGEITSTDDGTLFVHDDITLGGNMLPKTVTCVLTRDKLLACFDTPIEIVPAPGVGKAIAVIAAITSSRVATGFRGGGDAGLYYGTSELAVTTDPVFAITNGRNSFTVSSSVAGINEVASDKVDNAALVFTSLFGNFTAGAGSSATITVVYIVVPLAQDGAGDF